MEFKLLLNAGDESDLGSSHILGCPDVPSSWNDEGIFNNDEIFIGQLNLKELNIDGLPKVGILYFFVAMGSYPFRGIVRYSESTKDIERVDFNIDSSYHFDYDKEYLLTNGSNDLRILPKVNNYPLKKNEIVLLELNLTISNELNHLLFIIDNDDLKNSLFNKAHLLKTIEE